MTVKSTGKAVTVTTGTVFLGDYGAGGWRTKVTELGYSIESWDHSHTKGRPENVYELGHTGTVGISHRICDKW